MTLTKIKAKLSSVNNLISLKNVMKYLTVNVLRILNTAFGTLFLFSGLMKLLNLHEFEKIVSNFSITPQEFSPLIALGIIIIEILIFISLLVNFRSQDTLYISEMLILFFTALVIVKLIEGADISCGCFGDLSTEKIDYLTLLRNTLIFIIGFVLINLNKYAEEGDITKASVSDLLKYFRKNKLISNFILISVLYLFAFLVISLSFQNYRLKQRLDLMVKENSSFVIGDTLKLTNFTTLSQDSIHTDLKHKGYFLFLFSPQCSHCKSSVNLWNSIHQMSLENDIYSIGIALEKTNLELFVKENKPLFPIDKITDDVLKDYNIKTSPQTLYLDKDFILRNNWVGQIDSLIFKYIITNILRR